MANKVQELFCWSLSALFPEDFPAPKIREKLDAINFATLSWELHMICRTYIYSVSGFLKSKVHDGRFGVHDTIATLYLALEFTR